MVSTWLFLYFQGLHIMQQLQPRRAFTSLEASHTIHQQVLELPSLRNTRTINGGMLDRSTNQDMPMVRSHLVLWPWSLEVLLGKRKFTAFKWNEIISIIFYRLHTEILEFGKLENRIIDPTLPPSNYREVGLFLVDIGYCKKTWISKLYLAK